jgi:hypothetical protein
MSSPKPKAQTVTAAKIGECSSLIAAMIEQPMVSSTKMQKSILMGVS